MKKTPGTPENAILISKKAYADFAERITLSLTAVQQPAEIINEAIDILDRYVKGETMDFENADITIKVALMVLKPEIDKAMRRSSAARERARLRREKSTSAPEPTTVTTPASEPSETAVPSTEPLMNRRERREYERELAREERRYERRLMRMKKASIS